MRLVSNIVIFLLGFTSVAAADSANSAGGNVIFVTIDGVRYQEFFGGVQKPGRAGKLRGSSLFPNIRKSAGRGEAWIYGDGIESGVFRIGNRAAMSLPGYRGILSGEFEDRCMNNRCANIDHETIFDALMDQGFSKSEVAAFTSWEGLGRALESKPGRITRDVDHGEYPALDVVPEEASKAEAIAELDRGDKPIWGSRRDPYTYALGRLYLEHHRPRFLYLSFVDSDEYAHLGQYRNYVNSLLRYDRWIADLQEALAGMGEYGANTTIIVTTDHGRGRGELWHSHGKWSPSSFRTWAVVIPSARSRASSAAKPRIAASYSQLDIRPTIEGLLGVPMKTSAVHPGLSLIDTEVDQASRVLAHRD